MVLFYPNLGTWIGKTFYVTTYDFIVRIYTLLTNITH
jgi:hypothetical protein